MVHFYNIFIFVLISLNLSSSKGCLQVEVSSADEKEECFDEAHQDGILQEYLESKQETENLFVINGYPVESSSKVPPVEAVIESIGKGDLLKDSRTITQYENEDYVTSGPQPVVVGESVYEESSLEMGEVLEPDHKEEGGTLTDHLGDNNNAEINPSENKTFMLEMLESKSSDVDEVGKVNKNSQELLAMEERVDDVKANRKMPDIKIGGETITDHLEKESDTEHEVNKDNSDMVEILERKPSDVSETGKVNNSEMLPLEVHVDDFMTSRITFSAEKVADNSTPDTLTVEDTYTHATPVTEHIELPVNPPERLTMEETIGDIWEKEPESHKDIDGLKYSLNTMIYKPGLNTHKHEFHRQPIALKLTMPKNEYKATDNANNFEETPQKESFQSRKVQLVKAEKELDMPTDTLTSHSAQKQDDSDTCSHGGLSQTSVPAEYVIDNTDSFIKNKDSFEHLPVAEKYFSFNFGKNEVEQNLQEKIETTENGVSKVYRDYEDEYEEDKLIFKSSLNDYQGFSKEKNEPGILTEDCPDCDLRVLPIRPSEQRRPPDEEEVSLPPAKIRFAELPEGRELHINELGLSDGIFLFGYLSEFLSWIQPNEFPVELLRDALRNQITWISLITQSVQVEAGFVACLVAGVLLALAVPVVVLSHACYRMGSREDQAEVTAGWAGNCRRRTLVFILQLLLILLFAGMVAMFATNEQLSNAVVQSSDVVQTSLTDISAFVHNAHLQLHFLVTQSLDQVLQAIYADLDNVDTLLGRPIQRELVRETGIDVALDSLGDLTTEAKQVTHQVERFLEEARDAQEMVLSSRDKLSDLRQQVELFRRACGPRDRLMCDTIDASGLDVTLRLDRIKSDEKLNRMRRMGGVALESAAQEAKEHFQSVPTRVDSDTRDAREAVRRQLNRLRAEVDDKGLGLDQFAREISTKVNGAKYDASFWMQDIDQYEYWRWIICMGGGAAVLMIWTLLLCSMCCGCCGSERAAGPTILVTIVLMCLFTTALWTIVLIGLIVGGHGEVFMCRPLYDEPDFHVISDLADHPGVFYSDPRGGFIANVVYGNDTLDVPIKQVLQDCHDNKAIYPTLGLHRVFDVEGAVDQHRWGSVSSHVRAIRANLSSLEVLSPILQDQLTDLLATISVNFTEHRIQMSKPVTGKDMESFVRQLDNIGNQMRDLATASRMETLSSRTRRLIDSHIRPLETKKDALVYQLTALEVQTGPLQRQVNQSLSHLKTIQFFINSQGESIAQKKSREYVDRLLNYVEQLRHHVVGSVMNSVAKCRPLWDIFNSTRLFLCRHTMDPLNGYWFATMCCLIVLLVATPVCLKLVDYYRAQGCRSSGSPTENLVISEQGAGWSTPGYDIKCSKEYDGECK